MSLDDLFTARGTSANVTNIRNLKAIQRLARSHP